MQLCSLLILTRNTTSRFFGALNNIKVVLLPSCILSVNKSDCIIQHFLPQLSTGSDQPHERHILRFLQTYLVTDIFCGLVVGTSLPVGHNLPKQAQLFNPISYYIIERRHVILSSVLSSSCYHSQYHDGIINGIESIIYVGYYNII